MSFHLDLKEIRGSLGFKSGKSFYNYLTEKTEISFNYSYYAKIESGRTIPSYNVINEISVQLDQSVAEELVASYCSKIFPRYKKIFKLSPKNKDDFQIKGVDKSFSIQSKKQVELSLKQVFGVSKTFNHYVLFTILSLSRTPLKLSYLDSFLGLPTKKLLNDLNAVGVVFFDGECAQYTALEQKFPSKDEDTKLVNLYKNLDKWDKEIQTFLNFKERKKKFFIRRTSKNHLAVLNGLLDQLDAIVKISDEIDPELNNDVMVIEYRLTDGKMPG